MCAHQRRDDEARAVRARTYTEHRWSCGKKREGPPLVKRVDRLERGRIRLGYRGGPKRGPTAKARESKSHPAAEGLRRASEKEARGVRGWPIVLPSKRTPHRGAGGLQSIAVLVILPLRLQLAVLFIALSSMTAARGGWRREQGWRGWLCFHSTVDNYSCTTVGGSGTPRDGAPPTRSAGVRADRALGVSRACRTRARGSRRLVGASRPLDLFKSGPASPTKEGVAA